MDKFRINPWVAWFFLIMIMGFIAGMLGRFEVMGFCGGALFAGALAWTIRHT